MSETTARSRRPAVRKLPLTGPLRLARPSDMWFKPATSVVVATAIPNLALLAVDRLDLVMYTMAGSLCALYGHHLPYARRARTVAGVVLGMTAGLAAALVVASLTTSTALLIAVGALLAAGQKLLCDATRTGPPGPVILTFVSSAALFSPQTLARVPGHLALTLGAGAVAWLVAVVAPALVRRDGPERRATARALDAAAAHAAAPGHATRRAAVTAVHAAWQTLVAAGRPTPARRALERLVVHAETTALTAAPDPTDAGRLRALARQTRARGPVPTPPATTGTTAELLGLDTERAARTGLPRTLTRALAPGSPLLPVAARTLVGCALAGYVCSAAGVGRPYWAIVTAASLYQANVTLSWNRTLQRTLGNLIGVLVFAAVLPAARTAPLALIGFCLLFGFAAEALITRNYWLGSVAVTPMALLVLEYAGTHPAGELIGDRVLDTVIGAAVGFLAAVLVTNRRATGRVERALAAAEHARDHAARTLAAPEPAPAALDAARRRLTGSLVELREADDTAAGEWWQPDLPREAVLAAERDGHRTLAATAKRQGLLVPAQENGAV
ncbi:MULTISPECIES: FUSC family protein [unclassified Streptomyces]|uniref:FUSC family protein n=1 Tax=unclassified Streptomyces TaxID=2593676 RepID=UPI000DAEE24E|nr:MULTISPECIES: FUSC family protein [unclassified Streptomyces]PZT77740.1 FUSC family protein [Streptomyces sp. AC1-42W]PZT78308.1 FUSC family protein [Streptomyces sp. AC1-42T]